MYLKRNVRKYISVRNKELTTAYNLFVALRRKTKKSTSTLRPKISQSRIIDDEIHNQTHFHVFNCLFTCSLFFVIVLFLWINLIESTIASKCLWLNSEVTIFIHHLQKQYNITYKLKLIERTETNAGDGNPGGSVHVWNIQL